MIKAFLKIVISAVAVVGVAIVSYGLGIASAKEQTVLAFLQSICQT